MFARSQSGPGGLSINTNSANSSSAAPLTASVLDSGQSNLVPPSAIKPTTSLFGSLNAAPTQQDSSTSQPQQPSSLFGTTTSQPQQSGGLFGSLAQGGGNQQQGNSSSIFSAQNVQGSGGGLFGSQQNQQQTGGLFGSTNAQAPQPQLTSGLLGSTSSQQVGGLFSSLGQSQSSAQQQPQQQNKAFGGFGSQNKTPSLFGTAQAPTANQGFATQTQPSSLFSSQIGQYQKQQTVPGVKVTVDELRPTTRFNDLHEDLQKRIEVADNFILSQIRKQEDCFAANPTLEDLSSQMLPDIEYCAKMLDTMQQALENDAESIAFAKDLVKADFDDAKLSFQVIQNLSLPQQFHHSALRNSTTAPRPRGLLFSEAGAEEGPTNIVDYFARHTEEMSNTLSSYNRNIIEAENYLKGIESNTMEQMQQMMFTRAHDSGHKSAEDQVRELAVVLREFGNGILGVATKVGDTREKVQDHMLAL